MTTEEQHKSLYHGGWPCICPPDWPRDIGPASCLPCYLRNGPGGGIDRPAEQCQDHPQGVHLNTTGATT